VVPINDRRIAMGREVITRSDVQLAKAHRDAAGELAAGSKVIPTEDKYTDRLMKYIPAEVISVFVLTDGILRTADTQIPQKTARVLAWLIFGFLLVMTPFYLARVLEVKKKQHWIIAGISFAVWVFSIGGPFAGLGWYHPIYGALLLPLYTFSIARYEVKK
jgi:hypothetical protein